MTRKKKYLNQLLTCDSSIIHILLLLIHFSVCCCSRSMPTEVKNRVRCLKNIQVDLLKLESQFYQEVQKLEAKFQAQYQPLLNKVGPGVNNFALSIFYVRSACCHIHIDMKAITVNLNTFHHILYLLMVG